MRQGQSGKVRIEFFNIFETGAVALLRMFPLEKLLERAGNGKTHILIVGLGRMGESLILNAIRQWHTLSAGPESQLHATIVDRHADRLVKALGVRYPNIARFCRLIPVEVDVKDPEFAAGGFLTDPQAGPARSMYICLDDDSLSLSAGLCLHRRAGELGIKTTVVLRMTEGAGLATLLPGGEAAGGDIVNLYAFCLLDSTCAPEIVMGGPRETIARAIHEDYVLNEEAKGNTPESNPSVVAWDRLPERLKESNRRQADHISTRLRAFGYEITALTDLDMASFRFSPEETEGMARMEHDRWCDEKREAGYEYAAGAKSETTHPDLVSYDDLSEEAKEKDRSAVGNLPRFLARAGFQIKRIH
jgi:hypothetical protein